jgi:hypothetical protein
LLGFAAQNKRERKTTFVVVVALVWQATTERQLAK